MRGGGGHPAEHPLRHRSATPAALTPPPSPSPPPASGPPSWGPLRPMAANRCCYMAGDERSVRDERTGASLWPCLVPSRALPKKV